MNQKVVIAYHGHCFDGMCSAAVLTRFLREIESSALTFSYKGIDHQSGGSFVPEEILTGDINAVIDFRYTMSEKLTWWFDHHISGIVNDTELQHYRSDTSGRKFFEPSYSSCCKLIVDVANSHFNIRMSELDDLVYWADIIDSARFSDAKSAVELEEPALQLMTVIETYGDDQFLNQRIRRLAEGVPIEEIAREPEVNKLFEPLLRSHRRTCQIIDEKAEFSRGVVSFELIGTNSDRYNKFIPYWLYPDARYCVAILASKTRAKVSVGSNPWAKEPRTHDIAKICSRYGGGGHPAVGAVTLKSDEIARAREIGKEIISQLAAEY
ncbi:MAG: hypothetical protein JXA30_00160 [Deltaproteobacteria bacterium]|nr:hypothetical protein [Deltaproteobacteria bacterium]